MQVAENVEAVGFIASRTGRTSIKPYRRVNKLAFTGAIRRTNFQLAVDEEDEPSNGLSGTIETVKPAACNDLIYSVTIFLLEVTTVATAFV